MSDYIEVKAITDKDMTAYQAEQAQTQGRTSRTAEYLQEVGSVEVNADGTVNPIRTLTYNAGNEPATGITFASPNDATTFNFLFDCCKCQFPGIELTIGIASFHSHSIQHPGCHGLLNQSIQVAVFHFSRHDEQCGEHCESLICRLFLIDTFLAGPCDNCFQD